MKFKKKDLLVVCLHDITDVPQWIPKENAEQFPASRCAFCGWFVSEDKNFLRITHSVAEDGDKSPTIIPKGCIDHVEKVKYTDIKFKD